MTGRFRHVDALRSEYARKREAISARLREFRRIGRLRDERLFEELSFCILAVQSSARSADAAVRALADGGLLWTGDEAHLATFLRHRTRFHNRKAAFIVRARARFFPEEGPRLRVSLDSGSDQEARAWLVREVDGLGWKEASHFLRNIGRGRDLAILDRHILRNLAWHGVIRRPPSSLAPRRYLGIEERMRLFASDVGIGMAELDLLFWSRETGVVFK